MAGRALSNYQQGALSENPATGRKRGRPKRAEPTDEQRRQVESMTAMGVPAPVIARVLNVSVAALAKDYRDERAFGIAKANADMAKNLFQKGMGEGPQAVAAAIFWLKARAGWREADKGARDIDGGMLPPGGSGFGGASAPARALDFSEMSREERATLRGLLEKREGL